MLGWHQEVTKEKIRNWNLKN